MVTKKDFVAIAGIVEDSTTEITGDCLVYNHYMVVPRDSLIHELADYFKQENPKFDRKRFMAACGL